MLIDRCDIEGVVMVVGELKRIEAEANQRPPLFKHDGVACFDFLYTTITENVLRCVQVKRMKRHDPRFQDRPFMACFDVAFANRYLAALGEGEKPPFQPRCWQTLIDLRETAGISPLMFAVAGVNAHVNFDLPFALVTACSAMGRQLESGTNHEDYLGINKIFANHMSQLRWHFENHMERRIDRGLASKLESLVGDLVVFLARDLAWIEAKKLWRVHEDEPEMLRLAKVRDQQVAKVNSWLFQFDQLLYRVLRLTNGQPQPNWGKAPPGPAPTGRREDGAVLPPPAVAPPGAA